MPFVGVKKGNNERGRREDGPVPWLVQWHPQEMWGLNLGNVNIGRDFLILLSFAFSSRSRVGLL